MRTGLLVWTIVAVCACTAAAQQFEWRQMNSVITAFAQRPDNPKIIFAGDQAGIIRRSVDQGMTWKLVSAASEARINDIAFLDAERGFAATDQSGLILMTTDGGATWRRKQFVDAAKPLEQYRFYPTQRVVIVDDETAFFDIYYHPISAALRRETIVTRDGGRTFAIDSMPGEVYHVEGNTLIALGRESGQFGLAKFTTYRSTDAGRTWSIVKTDPTGLNNDFNNHGIELAFFLNENEFFITANKQLASDRFIYRTIDGGNTFTPLSPFHPTFKAKADYIYFKNASEGFAITGSAGGTTTFRTSDGGTTWTAAQQNVEYEGLYLGNDTFIAYKNDHTARSTDFGDTWTEQADPISTIRSSGTASLQFLQVVDDNVAYASLGRLSSGSYYGRELVRTTDGGLTWHQMKDGSGQPFKGEAFHFTGRDTFFFLGSGYKEGTTQGGYMKIRYTTDGGATSTDVYTGEYQEQQDAVIEFITPNDAVTWSINSSLINHSTDAGMSWTQTRFPNTYGQIQMTSFPAMNAWYVKTGSGKLVKSTDRGTTWNEVTAPSCGTITFGDAVTGYAHGCRGKYYKTTDGGMNWNDLSTGIAGEIASGQYTAMEFQNGTTAYLADPTANIRSLARTTDGGATVQAYYGSQLGAWVTQIDFADEMSGAMMDANGNFARYIGPLTSTTDTLMLTTGVAGIGADHDEQSITLYPNPADDAVVIRSGDALIRSIAIADVTGRVMIRVDGTTTGRPDRVATGSLSAGTYIVTVRTDRGTWSQRLTIIR